MFTRKNPFKPGSGVMPPFLAGREDHFDAFGRMLDDIISGYDCNMMLTGLRGVGKSTLLEKFRKIAEKDGFVAIKRSQFNKKHSLPEFFMEAMRADVYNAVSDLSKTKRLSSRMRKADNLARPKQVGFMGMSVEPSYDTGHLLIEDEMKNT